MSNPREALPGDLVIFDWNKATPATDHIGLVEINAGDHLQTIEGNTSNAVLERDRKPSQIVGYGYPEFSD